MRFLWLRFRLWWQMRRLNRLLDDFVQQFNKHTHPGRPGPTSLPKGNP